MDGAKPEAPHGHHTLLPPDAAVVIYK
jgi:hypothetical protein